MLEPLPSNPWIDPERLEGLIELAHRISPPEVELKSQEEVVRWAGLRNPIEAFFIAAHNNVPHAPPAFNDGYLMRKLQKWLEWANSRDR